MTKDGATLREPAWCSLGDGLEEPPIRCAGGSVELRGKKAALWKGSPNMGRLAASSSRRQPPQHVSLPTMMRSFAGQALRQVGHMQKTNHSYS